MPSSTKPSKKKSRSCWSSGCSSSENLQAASGSHSTKSASAPASSGGQEQGAKATSPLILLVGGTGYVGRHLVRQLSEAKVDVRVITRDVEKAKSAVGDLPAAARVEWFQGSYLDDQHFIKALRGVTRLFICTPINTIEPHLGALARDAGVQHIVKISVVFASSSSPPGSPFYDHFLAEMKLMELGVPITTLRCHDFAQNLLQYTLPELKATGGKLFNGVAQTNALTPVDCRDIAEVAATVLTGPIDKFGGRGYDITGPEALTYQQMLDIAGKVTGQKYEHVQVSDAQHYQALLDVGVPEPFAHILVKLDQFYRVHAAVHYVSGDVEIILGRPARSYQTFVEDHKALLA